MPTESNDRDSLLGDAAGKYDVGEDEVEAPDGADDKLRLSST